MNIKGTFKVLFFLRTDRVGKDGKAPIMARITLNGDATSFNIKLSCEPDRWDQKKGRVKSTRKGDKEMNQLIDEIQTSIFNHYHDLQTRESVVTVEKLRNAFLGLADKSETLMILYNKYVENAKKLEGISKSHATVQKYDRCLRRIQTFLKQVYHMSDIPLKDLKHEFIVDYETFLRRDAKCGVNTTAKFIQHLRSVVIYSKNNGLIFRDPFVNYRMKFEQVDRGYLTMDELNALATKDIQVKRLSQVRDVFLFCCYTGLAYIDVTNLRAAHIVQGLDGNKWIKTHRQKTKTPVNVPLLDIPQQILDKYEGQFTDGRVLPSLSNQRFNTYLKELASICGIEKNITFHLARHTFATTITLANGMPIETVSKLLGHTQIKTTQIYARITNEKLQKDMAILSSALNNMNLAGLQK